MSENIQLPSDHKPSGIFKKDSFLLGVFLGIISPAITCVLVESFRLGDKMGLSDSKVYLLGLIVNLFLVRYYFKKEINNTGKGVFLVSFIVVLAVFFIKK
ncbi:hypothetical protein [Solitalea canadensis]|uniref:Stationary phase survival protein SurE n=1 Tax=Solitalea canadensis (strain ATCC 29591 / DSM 3403 / JCM 21819 / LMG 8368 / NBRC 15130 / NCIMB 12057 / USAM 9D) TaxID=929556 RepID=H8KWA1_SOLCM|nr:hypothetical protein [Solitalea canadensis]AFD07893.1 hypothetical protein Solca_2870 [Solitalea canadensis DSM 3403]